MSATPIAEELRAAASKLRENNFALLMSLACPGLSEPLAHWLSGFATWFDETTVREGDGVYHAVEDCSDKVGDGCGCFEYALSVARVINRTPA